MRLRITALFILVLATISVASTNISGTISTDSTLTAANSPYIVTSNLTITNGFTLTVEPNVVVRFNAGTRLFVYGSLVANLATFTSANDVSGGTPAPGDWGNIYIGDYYNSSKVGSAQFDNCEIKYGGNNDYSNIYIARGTLDLESSTVSYSKYDGVKLSANTNTANISNSTISNCNSLGLFVTNNNTVTLTSSMIQACEWPIRYDGNAAVEFQGFNDLTGNTHDGIYIYNSSYNSMTWDTIGVPYVLRTNFTINAGETLTIAPTNVVKSMGNHLYVSGTLIAEATAPDKIYFTSYKNDNLMGDTDNDGGTNAPAQSNWNGIYFNSTSTNSVMKNCEISFAGRDYSGGITTNNASPQIENCTLSNNYYGAMFLGLSSPTFINNTIGSSEMVPIALTFDATPDLTGTTLSTSDNQYDALGIVGGELQNDAVLPQRDVIAQTASGDVTITNITYLLLGTVTVPAGKSLTINQGIVIKSYDDTHRLIIKGKLLADGTETLPIIITSAKDDSYGNPTDTNKDGTNSVPAVGNWGGIVFENGSDPTSSMNYCIVKFGYLHYWYKYNINDHYVYSGLITLINSSPTISNCTFTDNDYGIYAVGNSSPSIENCTFENSKYTPVVMSLSTNPTYAGNTFTNCGVTALGIVPEHLSTSSTIAKRNVAGYDNITYALMGTLYINSGTEVTINPGVVIKPWNSSSIIVEGGLNAVGSSTEKIVFTSIKDDNKGNPGDSNGDGDATAPGYNNWGTINFKSTSDDAFSKIDNCVIKFSGYNTTGGLTFTDANTLVDNTLISDSQYGIKCEGSSAPSVSNTDIENCNSDPIAMSLKSDPAFANITFTANGSSGIKILEGTLSSDATLSQRSIAGFSNISYIVDQLTISSNATLTINPGVVLKFYTYYNGISVDGALIAVGNASERIVFTSIKDDSNGGDTNNDGNTSAPEKGNWRGIWFSSSAKDDSNLMSYCDIRYGGNTAWISYYDAANVRTFSADLEMDNCIVEQSPSNGIGIYGSAAPLVANCEINNISGTPISMSMFSNPTFTNNTASNVGTMALGIKPENYSVNGVIPKRDFGGFTNITYYLFGTSVVNSGTSISILPGTVFKNGEIDVNGKLLVNGTDADKVVFTDVRDDNYGNPMDSNNDGTSSSPTASGIRIKFNDVSNDTSLISNAIFRYSDIGVWLGQASPTIESSIFNNVNWGLYLTGVSTPELTNCLFDDLKYAPFRTSLVSYPSLVTGNIISGSTYKGIGILDETLVQNVLLSKRNFAGITNIPYIFGNYVIASNAVLSIDPGVIIKFFRGGKLTVRKGLQALGNSSDGGTIVFTDIRDDFYGGDTNSDSTVTTPDVSYGWDGIYFEDESLDALCQIDHAIIQYAGEYYWSDRGAVVANNASPTVTNTTLKHNYHGLVAKGSSNPIINYCDIYMNEGFGVKNVDESFVLDAENNWWGSDSGPTHAGNPGGTGAQVTDAVDYDPWLGAGASNPIMGDVSLNGSIQAFDASKVLKHISGAETLSALQLSVADVSGESGVTAYDASLILQYSVGLITSFVSDVSVSPAPPLAKMDSKTKNYLALQKVENVGLSIGGTAVSRGESFSLPVDISNTKGVTAVQIEANINTELYKISDVSLSKEFSDYNISYGIDEENQKLIIAIAGTKPMETEGTLLKLNLIANEEIRGNHDERIEITRFLANESNLTKNAHSETIEFIGKPTEYSLDQNYPNPFNPSTIISYQIPDDNVGVKLVIYNIQGEIVQTLVNTEQNAGTYKVTWNATNNYGGKVTSGVYIYRITAGKFSATKKLMVLK